MVHELGVRVDRVAATGADLDVHVRAGGVAGAADRADLRALDHLLADADADRGLVGAFAAVVSRRLLRNLLNHRSGLVRMGY